MDKASAPTVNVEQSTHASPIFAFAKSRYAQMGAVALAALILVALTVYALLRVPRIREALRDVWPFKTMLQSAGKKKIAPARPFYDESSCEEEEAQAEPPSVLSRIVLLSQQPPAREPAEPQRAVEVLDEEPAAEKRATFSRRKRAA